MSTRSTYAPLPAASKAPRRNKDIFEFLHNENASVASDEVVTVSEYESNDLVAVTIKSSDGRVLSRKVPATSWRESGYRSALIRSMSSLVA